MKLLDDLLYALIGLHFFESSWQLLQLLSSLHWMSQRHLPMHTGTSMNVIHLLIPVYREAAGIKASVEHFDTFARYPNVFVHYITTEKEGENSATVRALKQMAGKYTFLLHHYPKKDGFKAHQLNWVIEQILALKSDQRTYFGIYDVDSRPEVGVLETLLYGEEPVYQQPSIYLENYSRIDTFQKAGALLQTKWELCRNVPVLRDYQQRLQQRHSIASLPCCTGHGLFIRADIFQQIGLFDTETLTEDLEVGYRLAFYGVPISVLQEVDFTEYAPTFQAYITQTSRWFGGEMDLYRYYERRIKRGGLKSWLLPLLVLKRYYTTLKWPWGALIISLAFLVFFIRHPLSILLVFLSLGLYVYLPFKLLCNFPLWNKYVRGKKSFFLLLLMGCIRPLLNSFGPLHFFLTTPLHLMQGKPRTFVRTPKN